MRRHDFGYFFHEGVVNLFSHGFMSFAAVGITVACLLVMGTFSLVAYNVNEQLRHLIVGRPRHFARGAVARPGGVFGAEVAIEHLPRRLADHQPALRRSMVKIR